MNMIKYGVVDENSMCDIDHTKKAEFIDKKNNLVVSAEHKDQCQEPEPILKDSNE